MIKNNPAKQAESREMERLYKKFGTCKLVAECMNRYRPKGSKPITNVTVNYRLKAMGADMSPPGRPNKAALAKFGRTTEEL
tara:strand:+ start:5226 stop:5468 length:243 start_codon:yes stop_codon:yes gene_type:complete